MPLELDSSKNQNFIFKKLTLILSKNNLKEAIVTTESVTTKKEMNDVVWHFIPAACYAYTVGKNTLKRTQELYGF